MPIAHRHPEPAVNNRDRNYTTAKIEHRREQIEESITRYHYTDPTEQFFAGFWPSNMGGHEDCPH